MNSVSMRLLDVPAAETEQYPDAMGALFRGELTGMVIKQAFPADALGAVVERLEHGDLPLERRTSAHFKGQTYGHVLIVGDKQLDSYFREAERFRAACSDLFRTAPDFQGRIEALLSAVAGGRAVRVPNGPDGATAYAPATIRGLHDGGEIDLHCENETVEFPSMWHLARQIHARNQLSYYLVLALPESGGELVIHGARFGEGLGEQLSRMERTGDAALQAIAPCGHVIPRTDVGDLLVFDSGRHFHRVTPVRGRRIRWTMGGFLARSLDDRSVYYWS